MSKNITINFAIAFTINVVSFFQFIQAMDLSWEKFNRVLEASNLAYEKLNRDKVEKLYRAAASGEHSLVQHYLEEGVDVNSRCYDYLYRASLSILHIASANGHADIVELLIKKGAIIDYDCYELGTSLRLAALHNRAQVIKTLIEFGAEIDLRNSESGESALLAAIKANRFGAVKMLLNFNADYNLADYIGQTPESISSGVILELLKTHSESINSKASKEIAMFVPIVPIAKIISQYLYELASAGTDVFKQKGKDYEQLKKAVEACSNLEGSREISSKIESFKHEISWAVNLNYVEFDRGPTWTLLSRAANNGSVQAVKLLLKAKADVNLGLGENPLSRAAYNNHQEVIKILLDAGANIKHGNGNALDTAIERRNADSVYLLLNHNRKTGEVDISKLHDVLGIKIALIKKGKSKELNQIIDLVAANFSDYAATIATGFKSQMPMPLAKLIMSYMFLHTRYLEDEVQVVPQEQNMLSRCVIA